MRVINAIIYLLVLACFIWRWETADADLRELMFYTLCGVGAILITLQSYENKKLNDRLNNNQPDNDLK